MRYEDKYFIKCVSTDVVEASVKAYLNAVNIVIQEMEKISFMSMTITEKITAHAGNDRVSPGELINCRLI